MDLHNSSSNNDNNVAAVVAMAHVAHAATALQSDKDKDKATVADLQKVGGITYKQADRSGHVKKRLMPAVLYTWNYEAFCTSTVSADRTVRVAK